MTEAVGEERIHVVPGFFPLFIRVMNVLEANHYAIGNLHVEQILKLAVG